MITGNQNPIAGKEEFYTFTDFTQIFETSDIQYNWAIWKKKAGKWHNITRKPPKFGKSVSFNFGEGVIGEEFRLEVYKAKKKLLSNEWEAKKVGEIFVVPTNSKSPQITKVILFNRGARDPNKASYQDSLIAQAHCIGMFNQEVEFNLWEDDAAGGGHNAQINKNNKAPKTYKARVNEKGIAEVKISLATDERILRQIANKYMMSGDKDEGANHEYYVTASYTGKIKGASQVNVSVKNPDYKSETPTSQPQTSKPKPKGDTPQFPATTNSKTPNKPDPQGRILDAYFVNSKGQKFQRIKVGEKLKVRVSSKGMKDKHIQYVIWEFDTTSNDEVYRSQRIKLGYDLADMPEITISPDIFKKGIDLPYGDPDEEAQNYFIEVIPLDISAESSKFGVTSEGLMKVENTKSAAQAKEQAKPEKNDGKCQSCKISLTVSDLDKFMKAAGHGTINNNAPFNARIPAYINYLNQYMTLFDINKNCYRRANFLGQVAKETKFWSYKEDFIYSKTALLDLKNFKSDDGRRRANEWGYARNKSEITKEIEIKIGNWAYGRSPKRTDLGNNECPLNKLNDSEQDGYKYRGRGLIQLTGRTNYTNFQNWYKTNHTKLGLPEVDFLANPDLIFEPQYIVLSAIYFWNANNLNDKADKGVERSHVLSITNIVNSGEAQAKKDIRYDYVAAAYKMLQDKPNDCLLSGKTENQNTEWHDPVDNPICTLYMQSGGGGEAGKHWGLFGQTRNGADHVGLDLFATKGTNIYACVDGTIYNRRWHGGYGNTITIKVKKPKDFLKLKKNYSLQFQNKGEIKSGESWNENGDIFLFYGHLDSVKEFEFGQEVKCGDILGTTGRSGVTAGTCAPHLHFEILCDYIMGTGSIRTRINPAFFVNYKGFSDQTAAEKKLQEDEKNRGKIKQFEGVKALPYSDIKGFIK